MAAKIAMIAGTPRVAAFPHLPLVAIQKQHQNRCWIYCNVCKYYINIVIVVQKAQRFETPFAEYCLEILRVDTYARLVIGRFLEKQKIPVDQVKYCKLEKYFLESRENMAKITHSTGSFVGTSSFVSTGSFVGTCS